METTTYFHKHLRQSRREIRIVTLSPGFWDDDISCTTRVVSLDHAPAFSALSYTWGGPKPTEFILLDEQAFPVMSNLREALRHLRQQIEVRILWIDFLCIDQDNNDEKSWQVDMMGDIYKACDKVFLWLGKKSEESDKWCESEEYDGCIPGRLGHDLFVDRVSSQDLSDYRLSPGRLPSPYSHGHHLSPNKPLPLGHRPSPNRPASPYVFDPDHRPQSGRSHGPCEWHGRRPRMSEAFALIRMFAEDLHINAIPGFVNLTSSENTDRRRFVEPIQALNAMMRRSWWHRIWTVQEAALPKNGIIMCGSLEMQWTTITKAAINWHRHATTCCSILRERLYGVLNYSTHGQPTYMALSTFHTNLLALNDIRLESQEAGDWDFMRTFHLFSNRHASDPRDKVYGLLGILGQNHRPVLADYGIRMEDLNRKLSRRLLLSGELRILYDEARYFDHETVPSWAKNFGRTVNQVDQRIDDFRNSNRGDYNATGSKQASVRVYSKMTLSFSTLRVDKVDTISRVFGSSESEADMKAFFRECAGLISFSTRKDTAYQRHGTVKDAFLRTAFGDRFRSVEMQSGVRRPKESELQRMKEWVWELDDIPQHTRSHLGNNIKYNICNRVFFTTSQGLMGFGPSTMRAGDEVFVFFGAKVPIVLRPLQTTISKEEDSGLGKLQSGHTARHHRAIIGDCYLHGVMEGEALDNMGMDMAVVLR